MLDALGVVLAHPDPPTEEIAESLLLSPLGRLDATGLRTLGRQLRQRDALLASTEGRAPIGSGALVAQALVCPELLEGLDSQAASRARGLAAQLAAAATALGSEACVEDVLWQLWDGADWGERLRRAVDRGGPSARRAHRDLDAVCALFDLVARAEGQRGFVSAAEFLAELEAQQIPGGTLAEKGVRGDAVRLLTAHRSKGLEWPLVVVAHVQEGGWPDLRRRASLLGADRIGMRGYGELDLQDPTPVRALLAEERRLFYVACTRARQRLVVTAVASTAEEGDEPSRFLTELAGDKVVHVQGRPRRPLTLAGVVSDLRRTCVAEESSPQLRKAAARRLAALAHLERGGRPLVPAADPVNWWGTHGRTQAQIPVRPIDEPLSVSASMVTSLAECPAKWFLEREAGGATFAGQAAGFGNLVHKIAEHVGSGKLADADLDELMGHVDAVWDQLPFRTPWSRHKEREEAKRAISRFLTAHRAEDSRRLLATEHSFSVEFDLPDGERVRLRGFADRVELDAEGGVIVVDIKTGKAVPSRDEVREHPQLGLYQLAVGKGAVDDLLPEQALPAASAGAELWQLRMSTNELPKVQAQAPQQSDEAGWTLAERQISAAASRVRAEDFVATPSEKTCRFCAFKAICPAMATAAVIK